MVAHPKANIFTYSNGGEGSQRAGDSNIFFRSARRQKQYGTQQPANV
jgi:hypothetical protein